MRSRRALAATCGLLAVLLLVPACQRMADVKTGTRIVDAQGRIVSENIRTVRVPMGEASKYRVRLVSQETLLASLYADAQDAIAAGNLSAAEKRLAEILALSASYRKAKEQYDAIKAGKKVTSETGDTTPGGSTPGGSTKPAPKPPAPEPDEPSQPDIGLLKWVPDTLDGFKASKAFVDPLTAQRQYTPTAGQNVATLLIVAEQFRTSKEAKRALTNKVKSFYSKNTDTLTINGHEAYFGTDGSTFAVIAFTDEAVLVAVEGSVKSGSPTSLKGLLKDIVEQLP